MAYNINNFLVRVSNSDTLLHLREPNGNIKWTINAFDIVSSFVSSNLLRINTKTEYITLDFGNNTLSKMALTMLQSEIKTLREITPLRIDAEIENYVISYVNSKILTGPTGSTGFTGATGPMGTSVGTVYYINYDGVSRFISGNGSPIQINIPQNSSQTITFNTSPGDPSVNFIKDGVWNLYMYFTSFYDNPFNFYATISKVDGGESVILTTDSVTYSIAANVNNLISLGGYGSSFTMSSTSNIKIDVNIAYSDYQSITEIEFITGGNNYSYISCPIPLSLYVGATGATGPQGNTGATGPIGPTGFADIYTGTSSTTIVVPSVGYPLEFVTQPGLAYTSGQSVVMYNTPPDLYVDDDYSEDSNSAYMIGEIDYYYFDSGSMSIVVDYSSGVGTTFSMWYINLSGQVGQSFAYNSTSTTFLVVPDAGYVISLTTQKNLPYTSGQSIIVSNDIPNLYIEDGYGVDGASALFQGTIEYYIPSTGVISMSVDYSTGVGSSGSFWFVNLAGQVGAGFTLIGNTYSIDKDIIMEGTMVFQQTEEIMNTATAGSVIDYNYSMGSVWYQNNLSSDYIANFIGLPYSNNRATTATVFIIQGSTPYIINNVTIDGGSPISINWSNNSSPIGTPNNIDIIGFTFINYAGTFSALAQLSTYGTI